MSAVSLQSQLQTDPLANVMNAEDNWDQTDMSIWEVRSKKRHYTYSKVMCWVRHHDWVSMQNAEASTTGRD